MVSGAVILEIAERDNHGHPNDMRILEANPAFERLTGISRTKAIGKCIRQMWPKTETIWFEHIGHIMSSGQTEQVEGFLQETGKHFLASGFRMNDNRIGMTFIDISAHKKVEAVQQKYRLKLETQVQKRTAELTRSNTKLNDEIESRRQVQTSLLEKSRELESHSNALEKANIALQVI